MTIQQLLTLARSRPDIKNETALANALGVSRAAIAQWDDGTSTPTPDHAVMLANLAGVDPSNLVLDVLEKAAKTDDLRSVIAGWKRRLSAAVICLAITAPTLLREAADCILCKITDRSPLH